MKAFIVLSLSLLSLNIFAAQVGESLAADCTSMNQSSSRDKKEVVVVSTQEEVQPVKSVSK